MTFKGNNIMSRIALALAAAICAQAADAAVITLHRSGSVIAVAPQSPPNPQGLTSLPGIKLGDKLKMSVTFDTNDLYAPGPLTNFFGGVLNDPSIRIAQLGNGNPVNAYNLKIGKQSATIANQLCFGSASCAANFGMEFPLGPTVMMRGNTLLGVDSCLLPQGLGQGVKLCNLTLDMLSPSLPRNFANFLLGEARPDTYFLADANSNAVLLARWGSAGVAGVPEPANWAMLIMGFGLAGAVARRRRLQAVRLA